MLKVLDTTETTSASFGATGSPIGIQIDTHAGGTWVLQSHTPAGNWIDVNNSDFTANGAVGDARLATAEDGREMIEAIERRADELIGRLLEAPEDLIAQGRLLRWRDGTGSA